ncbi:LysR family transcriptional regulator [Mangrovactinospora gilvigrisea]|uniref:LysR family transcriptional regulator n=1 Tax=Mangrovactinospora gilvigrisea TaxID=1428644 RepID=A0A1J7CG28_9ACTN|nr:LysR substrate-binding domain-containing protein [Mangrovactinospora gilvigrisea]OIV38618.1 LysR family transcriptional regulator [Mangrovactinospora gilvigrisea]
MQLQQLAYFVAVAETRHFTRAAERMYVAQPSLSKQIGVLEAELGTPLFVRTRGNITLTAAGETLLPIARRILADVDTARVEVQELAQLRRGRLRLGATPSLMTGLLPPVLRRFRDRWPGVELVVEESGSHDLVQDLHEGRLEVALVVLPLPRQDLPLTTTRLLHEDLVLITSGDDEDERDGPLGIEALRDLPLVMFRRGYDLRDLTVAACRDAGFEPAFAVEGGEMDAVIGFVRAGLGAAVVPGTVAMANPGLRARRFRSPGLTRVVALAHRRDVQPSRAAREFRALLLDELGTG